MAIIVGGMIGFGAATALTSLRGKWWLSIPMGALGGVIGRALWSESLAASLEDSTVAAAAVSAAIGGAALSLLAAIVRRLLIARRQSAPRD